MDQAIPDHDDRSLDDLREAAVAGDRIALGDLCRRLQPAVFRLCLRMLGEPLDAEEATQDVLLQVVRKLGGFEGRSALTTWVHAIAVRHLLALRRRRDERGAVGRWWLAAALTVGPLLDDGQRGPDHDVLVREVKLACTQGMLMTLSREERIAIVLVDLFDLKGPEAAAIAGVTPVVLRKRLSRARRRLGGFLRAHCGLANPAAACRCARQVRAKQWRARLRPRPARHPLFETVPADTLEAARHELSEVRAIARAFGDERAISSRALRARLEHWLPTLLGDPTPEGRGRGHGS
ncbi:MAG: sigma-70 family RNA polymerase sigma factor, partial [Myxococcota bacterium]